MSIFQKTFVILHSGAKSAKLSLHHTIFYIFKKKRHEDIACLTDS